MSGSSGPPAGILVLGMHRSGTSATAGALARLGFHLGDGLVAAAEDNPKGYFEHADAVALNDRVFAALGRSWDDVRALPGGWLDDPRVVLLEREVRSNVVPALIAARPWALKDPRMCRLLPLWRPVLEAAGARPACVFVLRHPDEVAASLATRDGMPRRQACVLWLRHLFEAVAATEGLERQVLGYPDLLADAQHALGRVLQELGLSPPVAFDMARLDEFLDAGDRHHVAAVGGDDDPWTRLAIECHDILAESSEPWAELRPVAARFDRTLAESGGWVEAIGAAIHAGAVVRARLHKTALSAEARAELLQARVDRTDRALAEAVAVCEARLTEIRTLDAELRRTQDALERAEMLSRERLDENVRLQSELAGTQQALAAAEAIVGQVNQDNSRLCNQLARTDDELGRAQALALERLDMVRTVSAELQRTQDALAHATRLCKAREHELAQLTATLRTVEAAQQSAEQLAFQRFDELQQHASALEQARIHLAETTADADQHRVASTLRQQEVETLRAFLQDAEAELARIQGARLWPAFARLSGLPREASNGD